MSKPIILNQEDQNNLNNSPHPPKLFDNYDNQLKELWRIQHPDQNRKATSQDLNLIKSQVGNGNYVYFPWLNTIMRLLPEEDLFKLQTSRNQLLISTDQQNVLRNSTVAFMGLSVGSHAALTWMMQSHARNVKIADFDTLDGSNLNRIRFGWPDIGQEKTILCQQALYQINPYTNVHSVKEGVTPENVSEILINDPKVDVIVDLLDSFEIKLLLRTEAKSRRLPLVMTTDVGNNLKLEIERYDLDPQPAFFNRPDLDLENLDLSQLSPQQKRELIIQIVGLENNSPEMIESLSNIGKKIVTWPQLAATATIGGASVVTIITKILQGKNVPSGIKWINLDQLLED